MKIRLELQRYIFRNSFVLPILLFICLAIFFLSFEFLLPLLLIPALYFIYQKKSRSENTRDRISLIERKKIDKDINLILIEYNNKNFLIFSNNSYAFRVTEEEKNVQSE